MNRTFKSLLLLGVTGAFALSSVPALAYHSTSTTATSTPATSTPPWQGKKDKRDVNIACMQTATDARETTLIAGRTSQSTETVAAYNARKTTLHNAWGIADRKTRREALKVSWKNFREDMKEGQDHWKKVRKDAWNKYKTDRKACGGSGDEEFGNEELDR